MSTLLLPCDGSSTALIAVRHAIAAFRCGEVQLVHLMNVQPHFSLNVALHVDAALRADFQRERAKEALAEARLLLDAAGVPYAEHFEVGDKVQRICEAARQLRCDRVLVGTLRQSALVRAVKNSFTNRLLERCPVPVEVIGGAPSGALERVGIPASMAAGMAWLWVS